MSGMPPGDDGLREGARHDPVRVEAITSLDDFLRIEGEWTAALLCRPGRILHLRFDWLRQWWISFGSAARPRILIARDREGIVGVLPLMDERKRIGPLSVPCLRLIGNVVSSRSDVVVVRREDEAMDALLAALARERWSWIDLGRVDSRSPGLAALLTRFSAGRGWVCHRRSYDNAEIRLDGGWPAFLAGKSRNFRASLKRARRDGAALSLRRYPNDGGSLAEVLRDVAWIAERSWQGKEGTSVSSSAEEWSFFEGIGQACAATGELEILMLRTADQPVAFLIAIEDAGTLYALKMGYDQACAEMSPGMNILAALVDAALDRGAARIDLDVVASHGEYKYRWATEIGLVGSYYVFRRRVLSGVLAASYAARRWWSARAAAMKEKPQ